MLRGIGLVWAWIALIGAAAVILMGIISVFSHSARLPRPSAAIFYSYQLLTGISGFIGYLLLISKKRMGIYVILLGIGLMLGAQLIQVLLQNPLISGVPHSHKFLLTRLLPTVLGALNPLFAYLAVKAGDQRNS